MTVSEKDLPVIPPTWWDLFKRLDWVNVGGLVIPQLFTIWGLFTVSLQWKTFLLGFSLGWIAGTSEYLFCFGCLCLTEGLIALIAGYHRLWSHRTFVPTRALEYFIAFAATAAFERDIVWFARGHRAHHRYIDTDLDPLMSKYGFWWRHVGFFAVKQTRNAPIDLSDLTSNPVVQWQKKYYWRMALFTNFILPTLIAGWGWGDWKGGFLFAGCFRINIIHHVRPFIGLNTPSLPVQLSSRTLPIVWHTELAKSSMTIGQLRETSSSPIS